MAIVDQLHYLWVKFLQIMVHHQIVVRKLVYIYIYIYIYIYTSPKKLQKKPPTYTVNEGVYSIYVVHGCICSVRPCTAFKVSID